MILGLDYGDVISKWPEATRRLAKSVIDSGGKVYIISWKVPIVKLQDIHHNEGELDFQYLKDFPYTNVFFNDIEDVLQRPVWKAGLCEQLGVELFIDDNEEIVKTIQRRGIMAVQAINAF